MGTILMFHRFADPELGNTGHDTRLLRRQLAALRRSGREVVSVDELVRRAQDNDMRASSPIAFTVDDGYADFATVAAPVFAEFDCPVTVFLVSGALDGRTWFWWDRITASFEQTTHREIVLAIDGVPRSFRCSTERERSDAAVAVMEALKLVDDAERLAVLDRLSLQAEVTLPALPPGRFAAMSWSDVRACARHGATFGAHTVSHPILSRVTTEAAHDEIATSWRRLKEETSAISRVFCYPNGGPLDFTDRESSFLEHCGFSSAVTTIPGYVRDAGHHQHAGGGAFRLPRFAYPDVADDFVQIASGIERAKMAIRMHRRSAT
jgi:peptidoglycan/xylan/chitin deacetylase (PgdA/CDA1 family)